MIDKQTDNAHAQRKYGSIVFCLRYLKKWNEKVGFQLFIYSVVKKRIVKKNALPFASITEILFNF